MTPPPAHATAARVPSPATAPPRHAPATAPPSRQPVAPRLPRRKSGPGATVPSRTLPAADAVAGRLRGVLDAPFLDRLTRGRAWIGLVAVGLIGIVFMQVSLLRLNAGIGRSIQQAQGLERENAQLRDTVSRLGSGDRIQQVATGHGLVMPPSGTFHYLTAGRPGDAARAARTMKGPINGPVVEDLPALPKANVGAATTAATPTPASSSPPTPASTAPATTTTSAPGTTAASGAATSTSTAPTGAGAPVQPTTAPTTPATTQPAVPTSTPTTPPGQ